MVARSMKAYTAALISTVIERRRMNACNMPDLSEEESFRPRYIEKSAPEPMLSPRNMEVRNVMSV